MGSDVLVGGLGPSAGLRFPPSAGGCGRGHGHPGPPGAGPTQGRLEGLSLDYVECFDLIPQPVVLRIARELGMDDGLLRALPAMYGQL